MKKLLFLSMAILSLASCSSDDNNPVVEANAVSFAQASLNLTDAATPIELKFAVPTAEAGTLTLSFTETAVASGTDFTTVPAATAKTVVVPFEKGVSSASFTFNKLKDAIEGEVKNVVFTITPSTNIVAGLNKSIQVNFNQTASLGSIVDASVGGFNEPNQLYLDLSSGTSKSVSRDAWDFGFYSGSEFRVIINGSVKMAVKKLETSDITLPQEINTDVTVGAGSTAASNGFVDNPTGVLAGDGAGLGTAIAEVSATDSENKVYLVNMGSSIGTAVPKKGGVEVDGEPRGWKKVRILRDGNGYKIQYANLDSATFTEKTIAKDAVYNFTFFSLASGNTVSVEPEKAKWDLNFTVFTNYLNMGPGGEVTYGYSDFITTNAKGGAKVYQVLTADLAYADFTKAKVVEDNFKKSETDQRIIGASWRNGGSETTLPSIRTDRFYVVKDAAGNYYKVKFLTMLNEAGERGHVTVEYAILK